MKIDFISPTALDLQNYKKLFGSELGSNLYISEKENKIIVVSVYQIEPGFYYEKENPEVIPFSSPVNEIGQKAKQSLVEIEKVKKNLTTRKSTDWPAYKVSGQRSVKAFQSLYAQFWIQTVNANIRLDAYPIGSTDILVSAYITPACDGNMLGKLILRLYRCCENLSSSGLVTEQ